MTQNVLAVYHPVRVFLASVGLWGRNFIPVVAIHSVNVFALRIFQLSVRCASPVPAGRAGRALALSLGVEALGVLMLGAFISLLVVNFLKGSQTERPKFAKVFALARRQFGSYMASVFLLLGFFVVGILAAWAFLFGGHFMYSMHPGTPAALALLLVTSAVSVALVIAVAWYGFYFTLAPLIAGFENKHAWQAFRESRSRIRKNALRYGSAFIGFLVLYLVIGLAAYFVLRLAGAEPRFFYAIDPAMGALFGPLWLALWLVSYEQLTHVKAAAAKS
ncbi:MAG: hypothetical protein PHH75_00770 [Candidatus Omnitrophica bacterium]|nr:hypothetical protein [Candidatus Omnitrophota bacterium]MDD5573696.1 hypothetical protein [Candidatus Omnitrophota bacterium]